MIKSSLLYLIANITSAALGFLGLSLFTRLLTPADFAFYALSIATASLLTPGLFTWLRLAVLQDQGANPEVNLQKTINLSLLALLPLTIITSFLLKTFFTTHSIGYLQLFGLIYLAGSSEIILEMTRARQAVKQYAIAIILRASLYLLMGLMLASTHGGYALVYGIMLGHFAIIAFIYLANIKSNKTTVDYELIKSWVRRSPGGTTIALMIALYAALDRFVIYGLLGETSLGQFVASQDIARQILVAPAMAISAIFIPKALSLFNGERKAFEKHMQYGLSLFALVIMPASFGLALVGPDLSNLILGEEFAKAAPLVLPFCALGFMLQHLNNSYSHAFFHCHKVYWPIAIQLFYNILCLYAFMQILVPSKQLLGASLAFVLAEIMNLLLSYFLIRYFYKGKIMSLDLLKVITVNVILAGLTYLLKDIIGFWGQIAFYASAYGLSLLALNLLGSRAILSGLKRQ